MGYVIDNINLLSDMAKYIAMQSNENCGVVPRDLTFPYSKIVVTTWNGCVAGRKIGDSGTNASLQILKGSVSPDDQYRYINITPDGKTLRSSSKYFHDEYGKASGSLYINPDITDLIKCQDPLRLLTCDESESSAHNSSEFFIGNIDDLLEEMMSDTASKASKKIKDLIEEEKVNIVQSLGKEGFFLIKKPAETFADSLGLSRHSIYNYLNEVKQHARRYHKTNLAISKQVVTGE